MLLSWSWVNTENNVVCLRQLHASLRRVNVVRESGNIKRMVSSKVWFEVLGTSCPFDYSICIWMVKENGGEGVDEED